MNFFCKIILETIYGIKNWEFVNPYNESLQNYVYQLSATTTIYLLTEKNINVCSNFPPKKLGKKINWRFAFLSFKCRTDANENIKYKIE